MAAATAPSILLEQLQPGEATLDRPIPAWIDALPCYIDYFLFLALFGWTLVLVLWWWHPRRATMQTWRWIPWVGGMFVLINVTEITLFNVFTVGPVTNLFLTADMIHGTLLLLGCAGLCWQRVASSGARAWAFALALGGTFIAIAWFRLDAPQPGGWLMVAAAGIAAAAWWTTPGAGAWMRVALTVVVLSPLLSNIGPIAWAFFLTRRGVNFTLPGVMDAAVQTIGAAAAIAGLVHHGLRSLDRGARREFWRELRPFALFFVLWLGGGLTIATSMGTQARRRSTETNYERLRQVALAVDSAALARLLEQPFQGQPVRWERKLYHNRLVPVLDHRFTGPEFEALKARLDAAVQRLSFYTLRIVTIRDQWLLAPISSVTRGNPTRPGLWPNDRPIILRRVRPRDSVDWEQRVELFDGFYGTASPTLDYVRIPLIDPARGMLGWLEGAYSSGSSQNQSVQARTMPFFVTTLGVVLSAVFFVQQRNARQREQAIREASFAAAAAQARQDFLAKVSHELRTPLQSILGYGQLLEQDVSSPAARERLAAVHANGTHMLRLVNDLLDLTAIDSGSFRFVERPTRLAALVAETVASLRPRAEAKGLALTCAIAEGFPPWLRCDGERCRQILLNLLNNAVKFTAHGRIEVSLAVAGRPAPDQFLVELSVRDTGPGIAPADRGRLFQPFARLDPATTTEGTGLGLAVCAGLCRSAGGEITVESDGRTGSCFRVRLPLRASPPPETPSAAPAALPSLHGRRILVVDDNALVRELFVAWLVELGANCETATDGEAAAERAKAEPFDALILDLALPRLDGFAVARQLRAAGRTCRIIGVSAHASGRDREHALAAGMDAFLTKPVDLAELAAALVVAPAPAASTRSERFAQLRAQLAARFRTAAPAESAEAEAALARGDWPALERWAHRLKGSAGVVGDDVLYAACGDLEDAAAARDANRSAAAWNRCAAALGPWLTDS